MTRLAVAAVKGTQLREVQQIELEPTGARGNRSFFVIDERDRMVNGKQLGALNTVLAEWAPERVGRADGAPDRVARADGAPDPPDPPGSLRLTFADGSSVAASVCTGPAIRARFYSRTLEGRLLEGPWADALSAHVGRPVRLLQGSGGAVDRGAAGAVSLISRGSLAALAAAAEVDSVDARRFRMLIEVDGVSAHAEDAWVGTTSRIGEAEVRWRGHVGRCLVTSRDPESGEIDLPTLDILGSCRRDAETTEPLPFGIYGSVRCPGTVRVGDVVAPEV